MSFPGDGMEVEADARLAVEAGFDTIATGDHLRHPRDPVLPLLDGWSVLTWRCIADPEGNEFCIWTQPAT
jgi:alkanesulfonate monooxygenase SsuD/methylene tetrahydromethanopterin reductase-like flavin-dependent oxidoreductase (luciferase family)